MPTSRPNRFPTFALVLPLSALVSALAATRPLSAQVVYVTTAADVVDFGGAQKVANLPGPDGKVSLAEAGIASDNTPGIQTIGFHVPPSEWTMQFLYPGRAVLAPFLGFRVFQPVILDGTTQTAFSGDTNPQGAEVVISTGLWVINTTGSLVKGLDSTQIGISGGSLNVVQGNTASNYEIFDSDGTLVGGVNPGEGNTGSTIKLDRMNDGVVVGNTVQRVRVLGGSQFDPVFSGNRVGGPSAAERNRITGYGNFNGEGCPGGMCVQIFEMTGTIVENNWIGTTADGMAQGNPATPVGIVTEGTCHDTIIRNNRIAGIQAHGTGPNCTFIITGTAIRIDGTGSNVTIQGNTIGLDAQGAPTLGCVDGIVVANYYLGPVTGVTIGGTGPGEGNEIAASLLNGVRLEGTVQGVEISGNAIHDNLGIGIDLLTTTFVYGVTPNDALDADTGANGLQNYPVLASASASAGGTDVTGTFHSAPNEAYRLEYFASPACDPSGFGEGRVFLGSVVVTTNAAGNASANAHLAANAGPGVLTATATQLATHATSEFSACVAVAAAVCPADLDDDGTVGAGDLAILLGSWGASGAADLDGDGAVGAGDLSLLLGAWGGC